LKDPLVGKTIAEASRRTRLSFSKPTSRLAQAKEGPATVQKGAPLDARLQPPSREALLVVLKSFDEVMECAADQISARPEDLQSIPLLFGRGAAFDKRMNDVLARRKESINLPSRVRKFMKEVFPDYRFDAADLEELWFRKTVAPTLDLLVMFDKVHFHGIGKAFGLNFAADFPDTPFGGLHAGRGGTRKSVFAMFHQEWEQQVWAYTTSDELATALEGCAALLRRILPALEEQSRQLLIPPPATLPPGVEPRGALSARQAFAEVLPLAREWAADAELQGVYTTNMIFIRDRHRKARPACGDDGRLLPEGSWGFKFVSRRLDQHCEYRVPHTGRLRWNFYPGSISFPKYGPALGTYDWVDSTVIAPRASAAVHEQLVGFRVFDVFLRLHEGSRGKGDFVWEAQWMAFGPSMQERRDITVQLDRRTGEVLEVTSRGSG
jgi:hypothetical protein